MRIPVSLFSLLRKLSNAHSASPTASPSSPPSPIINTFSFLHLSTPVIQLIGYFITVGGALLYAYASQFDTIPEPIKRRQTPPSILQSTDTHSSEHLDVMIASSEETELT